MKTLTPEQKLLVVREARKLYTESLKVGDPKYYKLICPSLGFALENEGLVDFSWHYKLVQEMFPELMQYKPLKLADTRNDMWWPREDTKTRLEVFDKLEAEYMFQIEAGTPWYTKLFSKIKNLFSWKRN